MTKKRHDKEVAGASDAPPRALLVGNHVSGFTIYPLPNASDEDIQRLVCHASEARLVDIHTLEAFFDKYGNMPAPANTEPKTLAAESIPQDDSGNEVFSVKIPEDAASEAAAERKQEREDQKAEDAADDRAAVREILDKGKK